MTLELPAAQASTDTVAPPVTAQPQEQTTPQAEKPAGLPQAGAPAGSDAITETASGDAPSQDEAEDRKTWKEKRQERNRERWQRFKASEQYVSQKMAALEHEVARLKSASPPDLSNVTDPDDIIAEKTAWKLQQSQAVSKEADIQRERQLLAAERATAIAETWSETVKEMRERIPDFDQVVTERTPIHVRAAPFIAESDKGGEIAYFLGKNPNIANDLYEKFESAPAKALIELGRIEARLSAPPAKTVTTAPRPAQTLSGGANPLAFDATRATTDDMAAQLKKAGLIR